MALKIVIRRSLARMLIGDVCSKIKGRKNVKHRCPKYNIALALNPIIDAIIRFWFIFVWLWIANRHFVVDGVCVFARAISINIIIILL